LPITPQNGKFVKGMRPWNFKEIDTNKVFKLYKSGLSVASISKMLGYSGESCRIYKIIKKAGLSRPAGFQRGHQPYFEQEGEKNDRWKGGFIILDGYKRIRVNGVYIPEHHKVWIQHNQIPIPKGWVIHHRNKNKLDNQIENLMLLPHEIHTKWHKTLEGKYGGDSKLF